MPEYLFIQNYSRRSGTTNEEKSVALMPFKNLTGDVSNDFLAEMHHLGFISGIRKNKPGKTIKNSGLAYNFRYRKEQDVII